MLDVMFVVISFLLESTIDLAGEHFGPQKMLLDYH